MAYCVDCGTALQPEGAFCDNCGHTVSGQHSSAPIPTAAIPRPSSTHGLGFVGLILGGVIGFLLRPSAMLVGQLPFETVISRGANLQGLDKLLVPTAQSSFNIMVVGAIVGAVVGVVIGHLLARRNSA